MRGERQRGARVIQRILIGGIAHETNAFSAVPTDIEQFRQRVYVGGHDLTTGFTGTRTVIGGFIDGIIAFGGLAVPLIYASATPGGIVTRATYRELRGGLLDRIRAADVWSRSPRPRIRSQPVPMHCAVREHCQARRNSETS